jgi:hypothetical protein
MHLPRIDREAGIAAYEQLLTPAEYQRRVAAGETDRLVPGLRPLEGPAPVIVAKIASRWQSSAAAMRRSAAQKGGAPR